MKIQMVWHYYPALLEHFYDTQSHVASLDFRSHSRLLRDQHYGWPGELCDHMRTRGLDASFFVANDEQLQRKWADENGFHRYDDGTWEREILLEQIRRTRPDILWLNSAFAYFGSFVQRAQQFAGKLVTWVGSPFSEDVDVRGFSVLLTENPLTLRSKQHLFDRVVVTKPGFDSQILKLMGAVEKTCDVLFVGQISGQHTWRAALMAELVRAGVDVRIHAMFTPGGEPTRCQLAGGLLRALRYGQRQQAWRLLTRIGGARRYAADRQLLRTLSLGPIFGMDLYRAMASARVVLNTHIDVAGSNAGNMRMFECTGVGSCLVTDEKPNLQSLFEPGKEVLVYNGERSFLETVRQCIEDPEAAAAVAEAGQNRTLRDHTLARMCDDVLPAFVD